MPRVPEPQSSLADTSREGRSSHQLRFLRFGDASPPNDASCPRRVSEEVVPPDTIGRKGLPLDHEHQPKLIREFTDGDTIEVGQEDPSFVKIFHHPPARRWHATCSHGIGLKVSQGGNTERDPARCRAGDIGTISRDEWLPHRQPRHCAQDNPSPKHRRYAQAEQGGLWRTPTRSAYGRCHCCRLRADRTLRQSHGYRMRLASLVTWKSLEKSTISLTQRDGHQSQFGLDLQRWFPSSSSALVSRNRVAAAYSRVDGVWVIGQSPVRRTRCRELVIDREHAATVLANFHIVAFVGYIFRHTADLMQNA